MDDQRKDFIDPKNTPQRNHSKQPQTYNVPTYDVANTNCTNKGKGLRLANKPWIVHWETERMLQKIPRYSKAILHGLTHPLESNTRQKNLAMLGLAYKKHTI